MTRRKSRATDPDFAGTEEALRRAARRARDTARSTRTPLVIWRDGRLVKEHVDSGPADKPD